MYKQKIFLTQFYNECKPEVLVNKVLLPMTIKEEFIKDFNMKEDCDMLHFALFYECMIDYTLPNEHW